MRDSDPLLQDFRNFLYIAFRHLGFDKPTDLQYDVAWYLQHGPRRSVIEAFRGVGKSIIADIFIPWSLLRDPQLNIIVTSATKPRADEKSTFIQTLISEMPELAMLIPRQNQRRSKVSFDVGPARSSQFPSVVSKGITSQLAGYRGDIIIPDDIEVPNNSMTQAMRAQLLERVKEFDAVLKPNGCIKYLGTPQTEDSLYNHLNERGYETRIWPARYPDEARIARYQSKIAPYILSKVEEAPERVGHTTEPDRFTDIDLLEREASYGRTGFAMQFMLDPSLTDRERYPLKLSDLIVMDLDPDIGPEKVVFASSPDLCLNDVPNVGFTTDRYYRPMDFSKPFIPYTGKVMFIDPSGRGSDETAWAVVGVLNSQLFLLDWGGVPGGYADDTLKKLVEVAMRNQINLVQVESNFGDGMFAQLLRPIMSKVYNVAIEDVRNNKVKELRIIDTLEPVMNQHKLIVNKRLIREDYDTCQGYSIESQEKYMGFYQMTRITRDRGSLIHDDRLDALAGAVAYWVEQGAMSRDIDRAMQDEKDRALTEWLREFEDACGVPSNVINQWTDNR